MSKYYEVRLKGKFWLHRVANKDTHTHTGENDKARIIYSQNDKKVYLGDTTQWNIVTSPYNILEQNTRVLMGEFPLPGGWNIVPTWDQNYIPIMTDTVGNIGTSGGNWTINDMNEGGLHNHGGQTGPATTAEYIGKSEIYTTADHYLHRHNISSGGSHFHFFDGSWRFANLKYCVAEYQ